MFFSAIFFDFWVNIFHQRITFHQHVSEGGAGEYPHHLETFSIISLVKNNKVVRTSGKLKKTILLYKVALIYQREGLGGQYYCRYTLELRGGRLSRLPAKMLSTVSSSLGMVRVPGVTRAHKAHKAHSLVSVSHCILISCYRSDQLQRWEMFTITSCSIIFIGWKPLPRC